MIAAPLVNPSDSQLNAAFALCVAGRKLVPEAQPPDSLWDDISIIRAVNEIEREAWRFTQSVDSVLPYLTSASGWYTIEYNDHHDYPLRPPSYTVHLHEAGKGLRAGTKAEDTSLARAMVIALLRAKGVGITFS